MGAVFLALSFVQGGQTLLLTAARGETEKSLVVNSIGRKWELTFTTLVLFGGALFAAFPLFYATSFGGAYWLWMSILFTFILQAVSFEFRKKPGNLLGARTYEIFLFLNGSLGLLLIGAFLGTFFSGAFFRLDAFSRVSWANPLRGLEALFHPFNLALGFFMVFLARVLGALYLLNNLAADELAGRLRQAVRRNLLWTLCFFFIVMTGIAWMHGYGVDPQSGEVFSRKGKYLDNLLAMPVLGVGFLGAGVVLLLGGSILGGFRRSRAGIWLAGPGTALVGLALFFTVGFHHTPFYPSRVDLQDSLTIYNASSSRYTLAVMTWIALGVPFVLAYIAYVWRRMDATRLDAGEIEGEEAKY